MSITSNETVASQWIEALGSDITLIDKVRAPDMRVWHSNDNQWLSRQESDARMARTGPVPAFFNLRAQATETGFVVQGTIAIGGGQTHIVQVNTVEDGLVVSCEEYIAPEMKSR
jgi:hypothetical protein